MAAKQEVTSTPWCSAAMDRAPGLALSCGAPEMTAPWHAGAAGTSEFDAHRLPSILTVHPSFFMPALVFMAEAVLTVPSTRLA